MTKLSVKVGEHAAQLVAFSQTHATVIAPEAAAPGARLSCAIEGAGTLRLKVARCVRVEQGFRIEGKPFDLTRHLRQEVQRLFQEDEPQQA